MYDTRITYLVISTCNKDFINVYLIYKNHSHPETFTVYAVFTTSNLVTVSYKVKSKAALFDPVHTLLMNVLKFKGIITVVKYSPEVSAERFRFQPQPAHYFYHSVI